jgi:hypothetical protein
MFPYMGAVLLFIRQDSRGANLAFQTQFKVQSRYSQPE